MTLRYLLFGILIVFAGCVDDAPHENPLDPNSSQYLKEGSLTGRIIVNKTTGVAGAIITHIERGLNTVTDSMGYFSFSKLSEGANRFICSKDNFVNDTFQVTIQSHQFVTVERELNGAPIVLSQNILTRKIDYVSYNPQYFVEVSADVTDPNGFGDLDDSVWFQAGDSLFRMTYDLKKFVVSVNKSKFPTNTISWLLGRELHIVSKDKHSAVNISDPFYISQIIENTSTPVFPSQGTLHPDSVYFQWTPPDITFNYSSTVTIYDAGTENVVASYPGIISFFEQYPTDGSVLHLEPRNYFWTVSIVDDFGNYSRSKESYFTVK